MSRVQFPVGAVSVASEDDRVRNRSSISPPGRCSERSEVKNDMDAISAGVYHGLVTADNGDS